MPSPKTILTIVVIHLVTDALMSRVAPESVRTLVYGS
jgi:hypothetical protein